jgi:DNA-binding NarL/FixJ family response regulator
LHDRSALEDLRNERARNMSRVRVLLIDDSSTFREVARELLERRGYVVVGEADCAAAALLAAEYSAPDAVLVDVNLPDATGYELAARLVRDDPELAVLLVSAREPNLELARRCPARGFVLKSQLCTLDFARFWPAP